MKRRTLILIIAGAALAVAAALVLTLGREKPHDPRDARLVPAGEAVRAFMGPLTDGAKVGDGAVLRVYDVWLGGIPVVLQTAAGHRCAVMVLKNDPTGTQGVANTTGLSIFIGNGGKHTVEEEAQIAQALAGALADREKAGAPMPPLVTLSERQKLEGGSRLAFPVD